MGEKTHVSFRIRHFENISEKDLIMNIFMNPDETLSYLHSL